MKKYNVVAAIIRKDDQIVMVRQSAPEVYDGSVWSLPGGTVEEGETFIDAAIREVKEETGLHPLGVPELIYVCEYKSEVEGCMCWVEMYEFSSFKGTIGANDPDQSIEEVAFFPVSEVIKKLNALDKWPMVKDPSMPI